MSNIYIESPEWIVVLLTGGNPNTWTYATAADGGRLFNAMDARAAVQTPQYKGYVMLHARGHYPPDADHIGNPNHFFWAKFRWSRRVDASGTNTHVLERVSGMCPAMHHRHVPPPHPQTGELFTLSEALDMVR